VIGLALAAVVLPFAAAVVGMLLGRLAERPAWFAVPSIAVSAVLSGVVAFGEWQDPGVRQEVFTRVPTGTTPIRIGLYVDGTAAVVAFMVCLVALAVQVYSVAYMKHDARYSSYAAFVSLFSSAMLLVVYAGDLLVLYVGWEVMGVCSYFLIGHHWEDRANSRAAVKAFLVTRVGDVGFLFGIFVLGIAAHSFAIKDVLDATHGMSHATLTVGTLLLLAGVAGKSAQFPLHTWLPDAMAGPTPISALIHAATMVAAGIYVVARLYPVFLRSPAALNVLAVMAMVSMLGAALAALAQEDLKRVLAYSTISQLGVMAAALAARSRTAAIFHLLGHGAFKALLFLAAGCVITATGSNYLRDMGGLRQTMPVTFWSMTVGFAALAGIPPATGFFTKDTVVEAVSSWNGGLSWPLYLCLLATVAVTAAYATRAWLMAFFGEPRHEVEAAEAPPLMRWTVAAVAVPALLVGLVALFESPLRPHVGSVAPSLVFAVSGVAVAFVVWNADPALDPARVLGRARPVFAEGFGVDAAYEALFVRPVRALAGAFASFDTRVVDRAVEQVPGLTRRLGRVLRLTENGNPQTYLTGVLAGTVLIVALVAVLV
jgi:NADH-quinone oxidoreductase subunit L